MQNQKRTPSQKPTKQESEQGPAPTGQPSERSPQTETETGPTAAPKRRAPGEGLDKSDTGVLAGARLVGRRFTV